MQPATIPSRKLHSLTVFIAIQKTEKSQQTSATHNDEKRAALSPSLVPITTTSRHFITTPVGGIPEIMTDGVE